MKNTIGSYGLYTVSEAAFEKEFFPEKTTTGEDGQEIKEAIRVRVSRRVLILAHSSGDKVAFQVSRCGKRVTYRDSRTPKKTVSLDACISEVSRMLGVPSDEAAAMLRAA